MIETADKWEGGGIYLFFGLCCGTKGVITVWQFCLLYLVLNFAWSLNRWQEYQGLLYFKYLSTAYVKCSVLISEMHIPSGYFSGATRGNKKRLKVGGESFLHL